MADKSYPYLLLMNDLHIGKENIPEFVANWNEALSICEKLDVREIAIGGDLFLSRASQTLDILLAIHDCLLTAAENNIRVVLANGNHCKVNQEAVRGYCHVFDQHPNVLVADNYVTLPIGDGQYALLHIIPYFPEDGNFSEKLAEVKQNGIDPEKKNFLYLHEGINGALSQPSEKELPANIFDEFERVFVGHYHNRCVIPKTRIEYIGSSRQHNFGEDEEKGYTVLYSDGTHEFIQNRANVRYKVIDIEADKVDIHLTDLLDELKETGRYRTKVRVHSTSAKASGIDKAKLLEAGASKVEIITEEPEQVDVAASSLFEKFDSHKIRETYTAFCREKEIEDVELGLSYLSKIS
ncbi:MULTISPECIES: metallophosphoesterase family protein [Bacteroides]|jgi:hypothetical protein|uniref:metallophosphoesterase family protein n=1 Tax=Bacteroides TaxID=816 RepID=UPI000412D2AA|nr:MULTISPECIES: phosphoesterase [Bacteroides]DAX32031.1 MAG TPA: putative DNA double strand break repair [Caudoviricetes sp.]